VGIGTSTPADKLDVNGKSTFRDNIRIPNTNYIYSYAGGTATTVRSGFYLDGTNNILTLLTNDTERMRIASNGYILAGTTSSYGKYTFDVGPLSFTASESNAGLTVQGSERPLIMVRGTSSGQDTAFRISSNGSGTQHRWTIGCNIARQADNLSISHGTSDTGAGTEKLFLTSGGAAYNTTGTWGTISDARLKENIIDATPKLSDVMSLQVRNFNFIGDDLKQIGFIAQEIEQVFPGIVETTETKEGVEQKTVKTTVLVPMLVKAIQELKAELDEAKARIAALEAQA
jgi:hypothetical protein